MTFVKGNPPRFLNLLEEVYEEEDKDRELSKPKEVRHNPSSASVRLPDGKVVGACLRELFYKANGIIPSDPSDLTKKLQGDFGNAIHEKIQERLKKSKKIKIDPEAKGRVVVDGLTKEVSFRLDGLVTYHGELGGLEIKTVNSHVLTKMVKEEKAPREADILQVLSYFGTNPDLMWFSIVYMGRDTAFRSECHIIKQEDGSFTVKSVIPEQKERKLEVTYEEIVRRWKELEAFLEKGEVPPRDYKVLLNKEGQVVPKRTKNYVDYKSDARCLNCSWKTLCWSSEDAKNDAYKLPGE